MPQPPREEPILPKIKAKKEKMLEDKTSVEDSFGLNNSMVKKEQDKITAYEIMEAKYKEHFDKHDSLIDTINSVEAHLQDNTNAQDRTAMKELQRIKNDLEKELKASQTHVTILKNTMDGIVDNEDNKSTINEILTKNIEHSPHSVSIESPMEEPINEEENSDDNIIASPSYSINRVNDFDIVGEPKPEVEVFTQNFKIKDKYADTKFKEQAALEHQKQLIESMNERYAKIKAEQQNKKQEVPQLSKEEQKEVYNAVFGDPADERKMKQAVQEKEDYYNQQKAMINRIDEEWKREQGALKETLQLTGDKTKYYAKLPEKKTEYVLTPEKQEELKQEIDIELQSIEDKGRVDNFLEDILSKTEDEADLKLHEVEYAKFMEMAGPGYPPIQEVSITARAQLREFVEQNYDDHIKHMAEIADKEAMKEDGWEFFPEKEEIEGEMAYDLRKIEAQKTILDKIADIVSPLQNLTGMPSENPPISKTHVITYAPKLKISDLKEAYVEEGNVFVVDQNNEKHRADKVNLVDNQNRIAEQHPVQPMPIFKPEGMDQEDFDALYSLAESQNKASQPEVFAQFVNDAIISDKEEIKKIDADVPLSGDPSINAAPDNDIEIIPSTNSQVEMPPELSFGGTSDIEIVPEELGSLRYAEYEVDIKDQMAALQPGSVVIEDYFLPPVAANEAPDNIGSGVINPSDPSDDDSSSLLGQPIKDDGLSGTDAALIGAGVTTAVGLGALAYWLCTKDKKEDEDEDDYDDTIRMLQNEHSMTMINLAIDTRNKNEGEK